MIFQFSPQKLAATGAKPQFPSVQPEDSNRENAVRCWNRETERRKMREETREKGRRSVEVGVGHGRRGFSPRELTQE